VSVGQESYWRVNFFDQCLILKSSLDDLLRDGLTTTALLSSVVLVSCGCSARQKAIRCGSRVGKKKKARCEEGYLSARKERFLCGSKASLGKCGPA
jgi:hypothetical protein